MHASRTLAVLSPSPPLGAERPGEVGEDQHIASVTTSFRYRNGLSWVEKSIRHCPIDPHLTLTLSAPEGGEGTLRRRLNRCVTIVGPGPAVSSGTAPREMAGSGAGHDSEGASPRFI